MENLIQSILDRRSIRKYKPQAISKDNYDLLLQAAMSAPSACNQQPWHFVIIEDRDILNTISSIHSGYQALDASPAAILVCGEPKAATAEFYIQQDCSAATQNILLAAHMLGLGAVWMGIHPDGGEDSNIIRRELSIPQDIKPFSLISIGYPDEIKEPTNRFNTVKTHYGSHW